MRRLTTYLARLFATDALILTGIVCLLLWMVNCLRQFEIVSVKGQGFGTLAIQALYNNYRTRPRGERAPESVYFMGMALIDLDRRTDACRTFDEFTRVYGATAADSLKARVETARGTAGC